jgi:hypothetical protein
MTGDIIILLTRLVHCQTCYITWVSVCFPLVGHRLGEDLIRAGVGSSGLRTFPESPVGSWWSRVSSFMNQALPVTRIFFPSLALSYGEFNICSECAARLGPDLSFWRRMEQCLARVRDYGIERGPGLQHPWALQALDSEHVA